MFANATLDYPQNKLKSAIVNFFPTNGLLSIGEKFFVEKVFLIA